MNDSVGPPSFQCVAISQPFRVRSEPANRHRGTPVAGEVLAIGWWSETPDAAAQHPVRGGHARVEAPAGPGLVYLVSDPSHPAPVWVASKLIVEHGTGLPFGDVPPPANGTTALQEPHNESARPHSDT